jgi:hypothetical protein
MVGPNKGTLNVCTPAACVKLLILLAPQVGLEPTTLRLTEVKKGIYAVFCG